MKGLEAPWMAVHWRHGTSMHVEALDLLALLRKSMESYEQRPKRIFLSTNCQAIEADAVFFK